MIQNLKGYLLPKTKRYHHVSGNILDVFTKTIAQLEQVNADIALHHADKVKHKEALEKEITSLAALTAKNETVKTKIQKIFE